MERSNKSFIGFSFNGIHSSYFHIYRTSENNRYTTNLNANFENRVVHVKGQRGSYHFGTKVKEIKFSIPFAFDRVTDLDIANLSEWAELSVIGELVFDETPYKAYWAKFDGIQNLKTICFDISKEDYENGMTFNVYKGTGVINFICYEPQAHSTFKFLNQYSSNLSPDYIKYETYIIEGNFQENDFEVAEWASSSGLLDSKTPSGVQAVDTSILETSGKIVRCNLYNPGDYVTYPVITVTVKSPTSFGAFRLRQFGVDTKSEKISELIIDFEENILQANVEYKFVIDTKTKMITCIKGDTNLSNKVCNDKIRSWLNRKNGFELPPQTVYTKSGYYSYFNLVIGAAKTPFYSSAEFLDASQCTLEVQYRYYYK